MRYAVLLCLAASLCLGFAPESFRHQSTAGIWEDDYDLIFDPGRLPLIDGQRIYTNLSNLVNSNETQFGPASANFFLVGGSSHPKSCSPAGIYDHTGYKQPLFTGLFGPGSLDSLYGSARSTYVEWRNLDSTGTYDVKHVEVAARNAWQCGSGNDLYLGVGMAPRKGNVRLGLAFAWNDSSVRDVSPALEFSDHDYDSSLVAGQYTWLFDDTAHGSALTRFDREQVLLSGWFGLKGGSQLGILLQPALETRSEGANSSSWQRTDLSPATPLIDFDTSVGADNSTQPWQGINVPLTVQLFRPYRNNSELRLSLSGHYSSENLGTGAGDWSHQTSYATLNPGFEASYDTSALAQEGMNRSFGANLGLLDLHSIGEKLSLGWGVQLSGSMDDDTLLGAQSLSSVARYDNGDSVENRYDSVVTVTESETWLTRTTGSHALLTIPVGLEFRPVPSIALRLGARHTLSWDDVTTTKQLLAYAPQKTRIDYGDGTFREVQSQAQFTPSSSETVTPFASQTVFTYGAGFRPTENLQIDLMGFANLTNLAGWRLSATFRF